MHRELAKARTRKAQLAAGALLLVAVAVVAVPGGVLSGSGSDSPSVDTPRADQPGITTTKPSTAPADAGPQPGTLARLLDGVAPPLPPPRAKPPEGAEVAAGTTPPPPPPPPAPPWRFIGVVLGQSRASHRAIVVSRDQQTMVMEGQTIDGDRVDEIHGTHVLVTSAAGEQRRVDMAVPVRAQLTIAAPPPPAARVAEARDDAGMIEDELASNAGEHGDLLAQARAYGLSEDFIARYDPEALAKVLYSLEQRVPGGRIRLRTDEGGDGIDAVQLLSRRRVQALDQAFHTGKVNAAEYKQQMAGLSRETTLKGTEDEQRRALEELIEQELGPRKPGDSPE